MVRDTFKSPVMAVLYTIFVCGGVSCVQWISGLLITWGMILSYRSQKAMLPVSVGMGDFLLAFLGLARFGAAIGSTCGVKMDKEKEVIVVGGGLAGLAAAMKLAEKGCHVKIVSVTKVKSSHSVCAQGGINAAMNLKRRR